MLESVCSGRTTVSRNIVTMIRHDSSRATLIDHFTDNGNLAIHSSHNATTKPGKGASSASRTTCRSCELTTLLERRARSLLTALGPGSCTLLEAPAELRERLEVEPAGTGPAALAQRLKRRFDAAGVCEPLAQRLLA